MKKKVPREFIIGKSLPGIHQANTDTESKKI